MTINCIHCGKPIAVGQYKDESERNHDFDTFDKGEVFITLTARQGFREGGGYGQIHTECFEDLFEKEFNKPMWAE